MFLARLPLAAGFAARDVMLDSGPSMVAPAVANNPLRSKFLLFIEEQIEARKLRDTVSKPYVMVM